jgi:hypothetical protein
MSDFSLTRRDFIHSSATALAAGAVLANLPQSLFAEGVPFEHDPYNDNTVVRVYDPSVSSFVFGTTEKNFYYRTFDIGKLQHMLETGLLQLSGAATPDAAWRKLLPGLSTASKIAVKININCAHELEGDHGAHWASAPNTSPSMMAALAKSLEKAGIPQQNVTFFDRSRTFEKEWKADLFAQCPNVLAQGLKEVAGSGTSIVLSNGLPSIEIPQPVMAADYLINLHLFKKHYSGATGAMKNLLGLADNVGKIAHQGGAKEFHTGPLLKEISMNAEIRKRAVLCICEAVFGNRLPTENIGPLQKTDAFPNGKPSSLIVSRSPFFHDLAILNYINYEMTGDVNTVCPDGNIGWLRNCANAVPNFTADVIGSARLIDTPSGSLLPPRDLAYPPAKLRFFSLGPRQIAG